MAHEVHHTDRYFWDNAKRRPALGWIVQQTLSGSAFFENSRERWKVEALAELSFRFLIALYREQVTDTQGEDPIAYGRHLLESQFRSPRNLKEWAEGIGGSREHFTRRFQDRYGESPASFLRRLRLEHALLLLGTSHMNLEDVAAACGFSAAQTFHRAYRRHFGESAGRARKPKA